MGVKEVRLLTPQRLNLPRIEKKHRHLNLGRRCHDTISLSCSLTALLPHHFSRNPTNDWR